MGRRDEFDVYEKDGNRVTWRKSKDTDTVQDGTDAGSRWRNIRNTVGSIVVCGAILGTAVLGGQWLHDAPDTGQDGYEEPDAEREVQTMESRGSSVLEGYRLHGLRAQYAGVEPGTVFDDGAASSFREELQESWREKRMKASNEAAVDHVVKSQVNTYSSRTSPTPSLDEYIAGMEAGFHANHDDTEWGQIQRDFQLSDYEVDAVRAALGSVSGETLGAYAMTELFPQAPNDREHAAQKNEAVLDYALRNAGTDYVELQPALFDEYLSFGQFQHTSFVVRNDPHVTAAANLVNNALPEHHHVPGSMQYVDDERHVDAAYGLLTTQLSRLVRGTDSTGTARISSASDKELSMIAAGLHHNPSDTWAAIGDWREKGGDLQAQWFNGTTDYVKQTVTNYEELSSPSTLRPMKTYFRRSERNPCGDEFVYFDVEGRMADESPLHVSSRFDEFDAATGDRFERTGNLNVVDSNCDLYDGRSEDMYFRAHPR